MLINSYIDHTMLKPSTTERDIITLCEEARQNRFYAVCISSCYVKLAKEILKHSDVRICSVIGFPLGNTSTESKIYEAKEAISKGASEIDMVMNIGFLRSRNYMAVLKDIAEVKAAIGRIPLKVIIEISELSKNEIVRACEICIDARADFVKTSTGFGTSGATLTAVKIMRKTVKDKLKIKASGGIRDYETAIKYIEAGVDRIGTSSGIAIVSKSHLQAS